MKIEDEFYLVWEPTSGYTKYRHRDKQDARREAERLAAENHGELFYVLKALTVTRAIKPVETEELNTIPF